MTPKMVDAHCAEVCSNLLKGSINHVTFAYNKKIYMYLDIPELSCRKDTALVKWEMFNLVS